MRRHNLDAIRNVKLLMGSDNTIDLNRNRGSQNQYNDVLVTIYDACILFLESIYHGNSYPEVKEHNLKELVDSIANRHYNLRSECKDYERLYHIYELVYGNYKYASFDDVKYAVNTLNAIMHFYMGECKVSDLEFAVNMSHCLSECGLYPFLLAFALPTCVVLFCVVLFSCSSSRRSSPLYETPHC